MVTIANGKQLPIKGRGMVRMSATDSAKEETMEWDLEHTIYVPELDRRLISTEFMNEEHGHGVSLEPGYIDLKLRPDNEEDNAVTITIPKKFRIDASNGNLLWSDEKVWKKRCADPTNPIIVTPIEGFKRSERYKTVPTIPTKNTKRVSFANAVDEQDGNDHGNAQEEKGDNILDARKGQQIIAAEQEEAIVNRAEERPGKRMIPLSLLHRRLAHCSIPGLLLAHTEDVWNDVQAYINEPDAICPTCKITMSRKAKRNKHS